MSTLETLDVGQANELKLAFRRTGWTNEELKRLCEGNILADVRNVLLGHAEVKMLRHVIDCDADPFVPAGWKVEEHRKQGFLRWDPARVQFFLSDHQKAGTISGHNLRKEVAGKPVLPANVLDYLLEHTEIIPEEWKRDEQNRTRYIFFWGTIYRDPGGSLFVRCLCWCEGCWQWRWGWLGSDWGVRDPAALLASF